MSSADTYPDSGIIDPRVDYVYRGFLLRPPGFMDIDPLIQVEYQVSTSEDASYWGDWEDLATVKRASRFAYIHSDLISVIYYRYRARYTFTDASQTDWSDYNISGAGGVDPSTSKIDETAASLGTISAGYMRGVVFETSASAPKLRMDPSGFYSVTTTSTPISILSNGSATFSGVVNAEGVDLDASTLADAVFNRAERVRWLTTGTDGYANASTPVGQVYGLELGGGTYGAVLSSVHPTDPVHQKSEIVAYTDVGNVSGITAQIYSVGAVSRFRQILKNDDTSNFLRFYPGHTSNDSIDYGADTFTFSGGTSTKQIAHNLGVTPTVAFASVLTQGGGDNNVCYVGIDSMDSTNITFRARAYAGITGDLYFYWVAIG